jgi:hypothetical protein
MLHKTVEHYIIQIGGLICFRWHPLNIPFNSVPILQIYNTIVPVVGAKK